MQKIFIISLTLNTVENIVYFVNIRVRELYNNQ